MTLRIKENSLSGTLKQANFWLKFRLVCYGLALIQGLFSPPAFINDHDMSPSEKGIFCGIVFLCAFFVPFMISAVIGIQARNPGSDKEWNFPTHTANPFRLGNPLLFFHFVACLIIAAGAGSLLASPVRGLNGVLNGVLLLMYGFFFIYGVNRSTRVYKHKMASIAVDPALKGQS